MFITKKVFDPTLRGMAAFISGYDTKGILWNETYLVTGTEGEYIHVVGVNAIEQKLHMDNFEHSEGLKMQLLELPQSEKLPFDDFDIIEDLEDEPIKKKNRTGFTRKQGTKNFRSDLQIKVDNAHVEHILKENVEPLKLEELLRRMREDHGHLHWNDKNASGFVLHAIKMGKRIKKAGFAYYSYDWEAAK